MIWLIKKIFGLGVLIALIFLALNFNVGGRPLKDYLSDFYHSPIMQAAFHEGLEQVQGYFKKGVVPAKSSVGAPMEDVREDEKEELEKVLKQAR